MQINKPAELDVENKGSAIAIPLGARVNVTMRYARRFAAFFGMRTAEWHGLVTQISATLAGGREHRAAAEREIFHGEYRLFAKGDDDLPVMRILRSTSMHNNNEPRSRLPQPIFVIGQDSCGNWVVQDQAGARGGLFVNRAEALRYIRLESARQALVIGAASLELELSTAAIAGPELGCDATQERRVA